MKCQFCDFETPNKIALANHWDNVHKAELDTPAPSSLEEKMVKYLDGYKVGFYDKTQAKSQLKQLILKDFLEMIGADEKPNYADNTTLAQQTWFEGRNALRAELRQSARKRYQ